MILLRSDIKAQLGKGGGDKIHVKVELDAKKREVSLAPDIKAAYKKAGVLDKFESLAFSHQREYNQWIEEAKKPETRDSRIQKSIAQINAKASGKSAL